MQSVKTDETLLCAVIEAADCPQLPLEVIRQIAALLGPREWAASAGLTCRAFNTITWDELVIDTNHTGVHPDMRWVTARWAACRSLSFTNYWDRTAHEIGAALATRPCAAAQLKRLSIKCAPGHAPDGQTLCSLLSRLSACMPALEGFSACMRAAPAVPAFSGLRHLALSAGAELGQQADGQWAYDVSPIADIPNLETLALDTPGKDRIASIKRLDLKHLVHLHTATFDYVVPEELVLCESVTVRVSCPANNLPSKVWAGVHVKRLSVYSNEDPWRPIRNSTGKQANA
jgi:hypothetical protein